MSRLRGARPQAGSQGPRLRHAALLAVLLGATGCAPGASTPPAPQPDGGEEGEAGVQSTCHDPDGDRYGEGIGCLGADCDETDPFVHPRAPESCDGRDDACDRVPDPCECSPWLGAAECDEGAVCAPTGESLVARCVPPPGGEPVADGQPCGSAPCRPGSYCVRWGEGQQLCTHTCDFYRGVGCPAPLECLSFLASNEAIGLCREPPATCDVYDAASCPVGQACRPFFRPVGEPDLRCLAAGDRQVGQVCQGGAGECLPGRLCVRHAEALERTCVRVCQQDRDCPAGEGVCEGRTVVLDIGYCH